MKQYTDLMASRAESTLDFDAVMKSKNIRYGMPYATFDDLISYFDISRLPDYAGMPVPLVGHIILTRPSLYVDVYGRSGGTARANYNAMLSNPMTATFVNDQYGKRLLHMLSEFNTSPYMPIFTTRATSYSVQDVSLKTVEKAQTYYGHVIKYGKHSEEHKIGGSISLDFRNDRYNSILKTVHLWASYIWIVSKNDSIEPSDTSQKNGILDYGGSLYYFVTDMGMSRLYYWEKLTGVFPKVSPFSIFSYNDAPILEDKLSVEFDYGVKSDPCDPDVLFDINMLSASSYYGAVLYFNRGATGQSTPKFNGTNVTWGSLARPDSYERPFGLGNSFAIRPIVQRQVTNGDVSYHLQYISA
ncbi:MAG: hypothetical protein NC311_05725 [Muribaculaceae bacterium]|nr:hypothetical protein [Muribaculaceae bacterium]